MAQLQWTQLDPHTQGLRRQHEDDAGWDVATIESYVLAPGERHVFSTGFAAALPTATVAILKDRSSLGSKGIHVLAGVIDAGYRGEWKVVLLNTSDEPYEVKVGDRIAQCLILALPQITAEQVSELPASSRQQGGFGSTGR